jgi:hypothetical protein
MIFITPMTGSTEAISSSIKVSNPAFKTRESLVTPELLEEIASPVSRRVMAASEIDIKNVKTVDDVKVWVYQNCPAVKVATIPGKTSFYLPKNSAIAIGSETESKYLSFVAAHEISHHYQWAENNGDLKKWNSGLRHNEGARPKLEVQADHMTFEVIGYQPEIATYTKKKATSSERKEALRILEFGKTTSC